MTKAPISGFTFSGFTLAELLIALAILGVIATFTIPKVLSTQQANTFNAAAKEDVAAVSTAFQVIRYSSDNTYDESTFQLDDLTQYLNYVSVDSTSNLDNVTGYSGVTSCSDGSAACFKLHNGSTLFWFTALQTFSGGQVIFFVDPDGIALDAASTNGPSKSIGFIFSTTGRIQTYDANTPDWFSW